MKNSLTIQSYRGPYKASFENDLRFLDALKEKPGIWAIDRNVFNVYRQHFDSIGSDSIVLIDAKEEEKTVDSAMRLCRELVTKSCKRNTDFVSVGGGITQDITGFVASALYRGLNWTYVPTTLLAQADSCIGSKTSLNLDSYKNLVGTFYPPKRIFISYEFTKTLNPKEIFSGFGEIVKLHLMQAKNLGDFSALAHRLKNDDPSNLLYDSLLIKKEYIEEDEFDEGRRKLLNYGHCFGHALESASEFTIPHGLAVVAGMIFASAVSLKRQLIDGEVFDFMVKQILSPSFHGELLNLQNKFFDTDNLWQAMRKDKKRTGEGVAIILPHRDSHLLLVQDLSREEFTWGLETLKKLLA